MKRKQITAAVLILVFTAGSFVFAQGDGYSRALYNQQQETPGLALQQNETRQIAQKVLPSVVYIDVVDIVQKQVVNPVNPFQFFFGQQNPGSQQEQQEPQTREFRQEGLGSGVIVRKSGNQVYVLTNNHVAGNADEITVHLYDGRTFSGTLVGADPRKDLALVKFETYEEVPVAELGDSSKVQVGDIAFAVGSPFGFSSTFTSGIISALGRTGGPDGNNSLTDYIQTDAAINPGNSGGALVNIEGQVIGINTWIASQSGGSIGLGFSIPINNAKKTIDDLISSGKVEYGWLGISMGTPSDNILTGMEIEGRSGAFVFSVYKDSPAMKSGILPGDFIVSIDNRSIESSEEVMQQVASLVPNKTYRFDIIRNGREETLRVRLAIRATEDEIQADTAHLWPGMTVVGITDEIRTQLNIENSAGKVLIGAVAEGSPAYTAGFRSGDIVRQVNNRKIGGLQDFYREFNSEDSDELIFKVTRQQSDIILGLVR